MRISKKTEYAVHSILYISKMNRCVLLDELAMQGISREYLAKVMRMLTKSKILKSSVGVNGGYVLSRTADRITLEDVFNAVEGENFYKCEAKSRKCNLMSSCKIIEAFQTAKDAFLKELRSYSIADIMRVQGDAMSWLHR